MSEATPVPLSAVQSAGPDSSKNPNDEPDERKFWLKKGFWVTVVILSVIFYLLFWQWLIGTYHYLWNYIWATLRDDEPPAACGGVRSVPDPWRNLHAHEWYNLQACLGDLDGHERQGEMIAAVGDFLKYLWSWARLLDPLPILIGGGVFIYYVVMDCFDMVELLVKYIVVQMQPIISLRNIVGITVLTAVFVFLYLPIRVFAIALLFITMVPFVIYLYLSIFGKERPLGYYVYYKITQAWRSLQAPFVWITKYLPPVETPLRIISHFFDTVVSVYKFNHCYHIENCRCDKEGNDFQALEAMLQAATADAARFRDSCNVYEAENHRLKEEREGPGDRRFPRSQNGGMIAEWWNASSSSQNATFDYSGGGGGAEQDLREVAMLQNSLIDLRSEKRISEKRLAMTIRNLEAQLTYAKGEGNFFLAREEANSLKSQLDIMTKERNKYQLDAMHLQIDLHKALEETTRKCKNEARCSMRIRKLEGEKKLLLDQHTANDLMVQEAAKEFGKSEEEARRYTLRMYLQEITQAMVAQIAPGGMGNIRKQPAIKGTLNAMDMQRIKELEGYKNRLEDEVDRLGGNVQIMRLGLDPRLPKRFHELTYEDHANIVFPIYTELCISGQTLTTLITSQNLIPEPWNYPPPRSEVHNRQSIACLDMLEHRPILAKNSQFEQYELLLQSLVREEVTRLLNRVVVLRTSGGSMMSSTNTPLSGDNRADPFHEAFEVIIKATKAMDDIRPVEKRCTNIEDAALTARPERNFKIWLAMQEAIESEVKAIQSFNSTPPEWRIERNKPPPDFLPAKTFEDLVARLMKNEINTLQDRMMQLFEFMEEKRIPGTTNGQPRIQGPPEYQANWDAVQAARTYALLCRDHWYDECYPSTIARLRLPLDHPPLLHALRREEGELLVPMQKSFPWKLSKGGVLFDARIVEIVDPDAQGHPVARQVAVVDGGPIMQRWEFPAVDGNDRPLEDAAGNLIMGSYEVEKAWYEKHYNRVKQLRAYIDVSNRPLVYPGGPLWKLRPGLDVTMALMKAKKAELYISSCELEYYMIDNHLPFPPEWPHKGGAMQPPPGYGTTSTGNSRNGNVRGGNHWNGPPNPNLHQHSEQPASNTPFAQPPNPAQPAPVNPRHLPRSSNLTGHGPYMSGALND